METVIRKLLEVVEHLAYSHTFRSETTANRVHQLLTEARAALEPAPAPAEAPEQPAEPPVVSTPVDQAPEVPTGPEAYGNA